MKKEFKGTPGPWQIIKVSGCIIGVGATDPIYMTEMVCNSILPDTDEEYAKQKQNIKADMNLIATAPELLNALQDMVESWEKVLIPQFPPLKDEKVYLQAKEVINKALGE